MKQRPSFLMAAMALLAGASFAAGSAPTNSLTYRLDPAPAIVGISRGGGSRTKRRVKGKPHGNRKRRKNPFRGTTYARVIGVPRHIS